jgi:ABC-type multidrug transport system permease subunit
MSSDGFAPVWAAFTILFVFAMVALAYYVLRERQAQL